MVTRSVISRMISGQIKPRETPVLLAVSDAAILYGAQRYFDGLHRDPNWSYRHLYDEDSDHLLFQELLHNLCLYDQIILDDSSVEQSVSSELKRFISHVNSRCRDTVIDLANIGGHAINSNISYVSLNFCRYVKSVLRERRDASHDISQILVPWAYQQQSHHDYHEFAGHFKDVGLDSRWLPFVIFTWRALVYAAFARRCRISETPRNETYERSRYERFQYERARYESYNYKHGDYDLHITYIAAPGRLRALKAVLNSADIVNFERPREAWRVLTKDLPDLPNGGYDFSFLSSLPAIETSRLAEHLSGLPAKQALDFVCSWRDGEEAETVRDNWGDLLFSGQGVDAVGGTNIQIVKNATGFGNLVQEQRLRATRVEHWEDPDWPVFGARRRWGFGRWLTGLIRR